jgi:Ser/Thr protein kinase RdoA (MazF antagonist)
MTEQAPTEAIRLPHGYTNTTERIGGAVHKSYLGPDPAERLRVEHAALTGLAGRFPVPAVLHRSAAGLHIAHVTGRHGQEALDDPDQRHARRVLRLCGALRRELSALDPASVPGLPGTGPVVVHGDFGPQNLLVTPGGDTALAVIDWECAHLGSAVEDLAWAEWIVRTHHPHLVDCLGDLFAGYGARPGWPERRAAMLRICHRCREFCRRWEDPAAVELWDGRIAATEAFSE